ncbi:hypothetical protein VNO78_11419 [Psophocarpus tetragonolobus]|uniref:Uncharacterized protein n=1 Tax=Psophocarpus tetragonolobus TaxID=3891 RepID=A0AAN9STN1_PSOTE
MEVNTHMFGEDEGVELENDKGVYKEKEMRDSTSTQPYDVKKWVLVGGEEVSGGRNGQKRLENMGKEEEVDEMGKIWKAMKDIGIFDKHPDEDYTEELRNMEARDKAENERRERSISQNRVERRVYKNMEEKIVGGGMVYPRAGFPRSMGGFDDDNAQFPGANGTSGYSSDWEMSYVESTEWRIF